MKQTILDTNFILTCVKQKIDFFEDIKFMGMQILIPKQVIVEIEGLSKKNNNAKLSLKLLKKSKFKKIDLKTKNTDGGIIKFAKENPKIIVATLDREIKRKVKNNKLVVRSKKRLGVV